jgi:uncharacterized protein (TIGR02246 family)
MSGEEDIRAVLTAYAHALNTSDAALAASCYTRDGMFMPTSLPTARGVALLDAYVQTYASIRLHVTFTIDELVVASDAAAYALPRSNGTLTTVATGAEGGESNRALFIFGREDGAWNVARSSRSR